MKLNTAFLALGLALGTFVNASAETDVTFISDVDCKSKLQRPIAVPSSTGHISYLSVNTVSSACATNWHDDPLFVSTGGDSGGDSSGTGNGGSGCGGGDGGDGGPK